MARPFKKGLEYFPLDTDFLSNRKIQRLIQRYGCQGIGIYVCVLCEIYGENGYFIQFDDDFCFDIGFTLRLDEKLIREIVSFCVQIHLFDNEMLEQRQILSSEGIQKRFKEINKRNPRGVKLEFDLSAINESPDIIVSDSGVNVTLTPVIATVTPVIAAITPENVTKTPTKGKGKGNTTTLKSNFYGNKTSTDHEEAGRRAELIRMASDAARNDCHA